MKKVITIIAILVVFTSFAFATEYNKGLSIGADIAAFNQGVSLRYDTGRWCDIEGSFRLPFSFYVMNGIDTIKNKTPFDAYSLLAPELSFTAYFIPAHTQSFSFGLGVNGTILANSNGPSVENAGTADEVKYGPGATLWMGLKAAAKLQFDFEKWGFSITGYYPVLAHAIEIGHATLDSILPSMLSVVYNSLRIGFDFKI